MKVSKETLEQLKNFATINTNLLVREGNRLSTVANSMNILSKAEVLETFPKEFAIYDLNQFLSLLTMSEEPELTFGDESVTVNTGYGQFQYFYAEPSVIKSAPDKEIEVEAKYVFDIDADRIIKIQRAASAINAPFLRVVASGGEVLLTVGDPNTPKSNSFTMSLGESDLEFDARLSIESLKVIPDSYTVTIGTKPVMMFQNANRTYWLALDPSSQTS
tara:strand:- start:425 stop:1078 length:654 start_codon:yes stop_codon:yes gene_type:complete